MAEISSAEDLSRCGLSARRALGIVHPMKFTETDRGAGNLIDAYGAEGIRVRGRIHTTGLALTVAELLAPWGPATIAELAPGHLDPVLALRPELVLLGTGPVQIFPDPEIHLTLARAGIGLEVMDTGAACRTYNILVSEGRRVVAALLPL